MTSALVIGWRVYHGGGGGDWEYQITKSSKAFGWENCHIFFSIILWWIFYSWEFSLNLIGLNHIKENNKLNDCPILLRKALHKFKSSIAPDFSSFFVWKWRVNGCLGWRIGWLWCPKYTFVQQLPILNSENCTFQAPGNRTQMKHCCCSLCCVDFRDKGTFNSTITCNWSANKSLLSTKGKSNSLSSLT